MSKFTELVQSGVPEFDAFFTCMKDAQDKRFKEAPAGGLIRMEMKANEMCKLLKDMKLAYESDKPVLGFKNRIIALIKEIEG